MLVPPERLIDPADAGCGSVDRLIAPMRLAGVAHVLSLDPLDHPALSPQFAASPEALGSMAVFTYALSDPLPMVSLPGGTAAMRRHDPGHIEVETTAPGPGVVVVREAWAKGWRAAVDGAPAAIARADGRHMAVTIAAGAHTVRLDYDPPGFRLGVLIALAAAVVILGLGLVPVRPSPPP
jgi:hypothetical protein